MIRTHGFSVSDIFADPPNQYRPVPQWSWNGDLSKERITEQLEQFAEQGCGGTFAHARPGHITGYLTDRWFEFWEYAATEAERLGLDHHIYDEFMCPGGVAGGNTTATHRELAQQELMLVPAEEFSRYSEDSFCLFIRLESESGQPVELTDKANATHAVILDDTRSLIGGFPPPDMCRRETAEAFIDLTHRRYAEHSSHRFGENAWLMFCDEPMLLHSGNGLPWSSLLKREFKQEHGYDLEEKLPELCFTRDGSAEVRFDFWWTVNRLFNENFMKPLHDWCSENKQLFTGHVMEHEWPSPMHTTDNMAQLRWMHAPGEDFLGFQFTPTRLDENGLYVMNLKELASVTNQLDRDWSMVETCGGRGYHTDLAIIKPGEDLVLSFGVNVIDPHLSHQSLAGISKYDWPQTLSDHTPWWSYFRMQADHIARANAVLSQGREYNRIMVLHPTTSGWLHCTGGAFDGASGGQSKASIEELRKSQIEIFNLLYAAQLDFDFGDEFIMAEFGSIDDGKLRIGARQYDAIVIPPLTENLNRSTQQLLQEFLAEGGRIYSTGIPPARLQGRISDVPAKLADAPGWQTFASTYELLQSLREAIPPYLSQPSGEALPGGIAWRRAEADEGIVLFVCNPWAHEINTEIMIAGRSVQRLDTGRGTVEQLPVEERDGRIILPVSLLPREHELFLISEVVVEAVPTKTVPVSTPIELSPTGISRIQPNLLYIDYCDVKAGGEERCDINTLHADNFNWQQQGYPGNPWGKQFQRSVIDAPVDPESAFAVTYRFEIDATFLEDQQAELAVGIERPRFYIIMLNGIEIDQATGTRWFDEEMKSFPIGKLIKTGSNELVLKAEPFHVLCEIMPIYLIGDFSAKDIDKGFAIAAARPLSHGDWTRQGTPFYADRVRYCYSFFLEEDARSLKVTVPEWAGSMIVVTIDGEECGPVAHPPFSLSTERQLVTGEHELAIDILGNMKNMMGSHFCEEHPLQWSFLQNPEHLPPGSEYRFYPSGLFQNPVLEAMR